MLCSICYGSGIMPLTRSPSRVMRRTMARLVSTRLPCAACKGTGYVPDPAPARTTLAAPESAVPAVPPDDDTLSELLSCFGDEEAALFRKVLSLPGEAVRSGEFSRAQADANVHAIEKLMQAATLPVRNDGEARTQAARMDAVIADQKSLFVRPSPEGTRRGRIPDRAASLLQLLTPLKCFLVDQTNGSRHGRVEKERGVELLRDLGRAMQKLQDAPDNAVVRQIEHFELRSLAWSIRKYGLRHHVMVAEPLWGAAPLVPDATCVFFAGAPGMRADVVRFCEKRGLTLKHAPDAGGSGQLRWDQIRESVIGVFDMTMASERERASVCHALGLALALGRYPLVLAKDGQTLPFDIDIEPQYLTSAQRSSGIVAKRIDEALFGVHRVTGESSVAVTGRRIAPGSAPVDGVHLEETLGGKIHPPRVLLHPVWPAAYPGPKPRTCFHVMPFRQKWSDRVRDHVRRAVEACGYEYSRGDQSRGVHVVRSIWDDICRASAVVVDLTGPNNNVCLELGLAQAIGRPILLMTQDGLDDALFPEIAKLRVSRYSPAGRGLGRIVEGWCSTLAAS